MRSQNAAIMDADLPASSCIQTDTCVTVSSVALFGSSVHARGHSQQRCASASTSTSVPGEIQVIFERNNQHRKHAPAQKTCLHLVCNAHGSVSTCIYILLQDLWLSTCEDITRLCTMHSTCHLVHTICTLPARRSRRSSDTPADC